MWKLAAVLLATSFALAADKDATSDSWEKVKNLKTGSDLRIYSTGAAEPVTAKFADVTGRKLPVIIKNAETAINKGEIERIDFQPPAGKPVKTKTYDVNPDGASLSMGKGGSREGWQTVYQRPAAK
jgi:hypothetical protein